MLRAAGQLVRAAPRIVARIRLAGSGERKRVVGPSSVTIGNGVVYVGGGNDYWYALNAANGAILWQVYTGDTTKGWYNWASPVIYNGFAYVGIASMCDNPLIPGQLWKINLTTHNVDAMANFVPAGEIGGGVLAEYSGPRFVLLRVALDNLIAERRVPVMIAISIGNGSGDAQGSERGLEYDTMSGRYAEFVETEVLPLVEKQYNVRLTKDPDGRATSGCSSGGSGPARADRRVKRRASIGQLGGLGRSLLRRRGLLLQDATAGRAGRR